MGFTDLNHLRSRFKTQMFRPHFQRLLHGIIQGGFPNMNFVCFSHKPGMATTDPRVSCILGRRGRVWACAAHTHVYTHTSPASSEVSGAPLIIEKTAAQITNKATVCQEESSYPLTMVISQCQASHTKDKALDSLGGPTLRKCQHDDVTS